MVDDVNNCGDLNLQSGGDVTRDLPFFGAWQNLFLPLVADCTHQHRLKTNAVIAVLKVTKWAPMYMTKRKI
jgi:hypothetical protein